MLNPNVLLWIAMTTPLLITFGQWVDPDNAKTPWSWGRGPRIALFVVVSLAAGAASALTNAPGAPWTDTLRVALPTLIASLVGHFAHSVLPETPATAAVKAARLRMATKTLAVLVFIGGLGSIPASTGCLSAKDATSVTTVLTDAQKGCVWIEELAPAFNLPAPANDEIMTICKIDSQLTPAVEEVIGDFQAHAATAKAMIAQHDQALKAMSQPVPVVPMGATKPR